ncbi:unnamed protein product, partial [Chrysoparadoxa australica]
GLNINSERYLGALWKCCTARNPSCQWINQVIEGSDFYRLASGGEYQGMVAAVGAGIGKVPGLENMLGLRYMRGQSLLLDNTP